MSTIKADTVQNTTGGPVTLTDQVATKVWGQLNGTGTIAIRDSFNVSGATDHGTGDYSFAFTNSLTDANWNGNLMDIRNRATTPGFNFDATTGAGNCRWTTYDTSAADYDHTGALIVGDLA